MKSCRTRGVKPTPEMRERAAVLYESVRCCARVADVLGVSHEAVRAWVNARSRTSIEKLMRHVHVEPNSGCWLWLGATKRRGYGSAWWQGRFMGAHRAVYLAHGGIVPDGTELDHLCRTPQCVNPDHLEPVTHQENMRRGRYGATTHCPHGHPYDTENTYRRPNVTRVCQTCRRDQERARYHAKRNK